jgi:hypothetical protein
MSVPLVFWLFAAFSAWGQVAPPVSPSQSAAVPFVKPEPGHIRTVAPTDSFFRVICVVPLIGSGPGSGGDWLGTTTCAFIS